MNDLLQFKKQYFASSNSCNGFKSYFDRIFESEKYEKIYVLKGGPGTGKSTLLKKVAKHFYDHKGEVELFRCSSDPASLDGVIIEINKTKVAVLDGTAPHERDAVIPGAVDEIINLGFAWDSKKLAADRKEIFRLNTFKTNSYKNAYRYLTLSSVFDTNIKAEMLSAMVTKRFQIEAERISCMFQNGSGEHDVRLISSFSKNGYKTLGTLDRISDKTYSILGKYGSAEYLLTLIKKRLLENGVDFIEYPSPLYPDVPEALHIKNEKCTITAMSHGEIISDSTSNLKSDVISSYSDKFSKFINSIDNYRQMAQEELKCAARYHSLLEDIYTAKMNYDIINEITSSLIDNIEKIVEVSY